MYQCKNCQGVYLLTDANCDFMRIGNEINVKCSCGYLDIMVGMEHVPEENVYYTYSYRRNTK